MSDKSSIEWTDATWSPIRAIVKENAPYIAIQHGWPDLAEICERTKGHAGPHCEFISTGCNHCYSCTNNHRCLPANGTGLPFDKRSRELVDIFVDEKILRQPLGWKKGRKIFVENQSDLFGEWVPFEMIDKVFAVMALTPQHTYQVLTKRPERMLEYLGSRVKPGDNIAENEEDLILRWGAAAGTLLDGDWIWKDGKRFRERIETFISATMGLAPDDEMLAEDSIPFPLHNVWLGVSAENQQTWDDRLDFLGRTPAAMRFVSYEPALGPIDPGNAFDDPPESSNYGRIGWVIMGGESGNGARPIHPEWVRSMRSHCVAASVAFFFKQWGEYGPGSVRGIEREPVFRFFDSMQKWIHKGDTWVNGGICVDLTGKVLKNGGDFRQAFYPVVVTHKLGKKKAGAVLDGRLWREFPTLSKE